MPVLVAYGKILEHKGNIQLVQYGGSSSSVSDKELSFAHATIHVVLTQINHKWFLCYISPFPKFLSFLFCKKNIARINSSRHFSEKRDFLSTQVVQLGRPTSTSVFLLTHLIPFSTQLGTQCFKIRLFKKK